MRQYGSSVGILYSRFLTFRNLNLIFHVEMSSALVFSFVSLKEAMDSPFCHRIYLTQIFKNFKCDTFFPPIDATKFQLIDDPRVPEAEEEENGIKYKFEVYQRL